MADCSAMLARRGWQMLGRSRGGTRNAHEDNILRGRDVRATTTTSTASRDALAGIRSPTHKATESRRTRDGDRGGNSPDRDRKGGSWAERPLLPNDLHPQRQHRLQRHHGQLRRPLRNNTSRNDKQFVFHHYTRSGKSYAGRVHKLSSCVKTVRLRYTAVRRNSRNICHRPMVERS